MFTDSTSQYQEGCLGLDCLFQVGCFTVIKALILLGHISGEQTEITNPLLKHFQRSKQYVKKKTIKTNIPLAVLDLNMSSCPLFCRLHETEQFVRRQPSLNQCTMGTGKPPTVQCMETSVSIATVMLSGPCRICSCLGTPVRQEDTYRGEQHYKIPTPVQKISVNI